MLNLRCLFGIRRTHPVKNWLYIPEWDFSLLGRWVIWNAGKRSLLGASRIEKLIKGGGGYKIEEAYFTQMPWPHQHETTNISNYFIITITFESPPQSQKASFTAGTSMPGSHAKALAASQSWSITSSPAATSLCLSSCLNPTGAGLCHFSHSTKGQMGCPGEDALFLSITITKAQIQRIRGEKEKITTGTDLFIRQVTVKSEWRNYQKIQITKLFPRRNEKQEQKTVNAILFNLPFPPRKSHT